MSTDARVSELLLRWEERREQGRPVSPEDLCQDSPELLDELRRLVGALEAMNPLIQPPPSDTPTLPGSTSDEQGRAGTAQAPALLPALPGYEVLKELGRGGMGVVYLARQFSLDRRVALKMILADACGGEQQRRRFRHEAELVARLQHPNIVQIFEVGEWQGRPYCALEYVEGGNLAEALAGTPCPPRTAAELLATLAGAVGAAHAAGMIHRDLKPANVLLSAACGLAGPCSGWPAKPQAAEQAPGAPTASW
jgi:serine/threonine-protein kinase